LACNCVYLIQIGLTAHEPVVPRWCVRFVSASGGGLVLTIGKLGSSRRQLEYYEQQVAAGIEDYYAGRGEAPGRWRGAGAAALGLDGEVGRDGFMLLMRGRHPVDGSVLRSMGSCSTVAGLDLTFSAPKSVSVLFAIADDKTSGALCAAHELAVDAGLAYLEREACWTRRGHAGVCRVRGEGLIAASYRHRMSRAGDPQLHTHVVLANMTLADGRYTALDAHLLYEHKLAAGAVYRAVLRRKLRARLPWVSWREVSRGLFEIDGVPDGVLRHFSQRRVEIEERAAELAGVGADGLSRARMQGIALATRRAKAYGIDGPTWRETVRVRAAEHGLGAAELAALVRRRPAADRAPDIRAVFARLSGPEGLTRTHNTFALRHALAELAGAFQDGISPGELERITDSYVDDPDVRQLQTSAGELRYTTAGLLACEQWIIGSADRRATEGVGVLVSDVVDRALRRHDAPLNEDQAAAVRALVASGRGVDVVEALAGTGKTTMIGTLANCYRAAGRTVIGTAPTGRAARQLRDTAQVPATTMHALLAQLARSGGFRPGTVLVIDEAGMAPTRITAELFAYAERAGAKVIAVGDPGQLGSVQAGGWLAAISRRQPGPALREVLRQQDPRERAALEALHDGNPDRYLALKHKEISIHATESEALSAVVEEWHAATARHGLRDSVMIARDNHTREALNRAARARLKQVDALPEPGVMLGGREFTIGDRVIARRNDRHLDVDNGTTATIVAINPATNVIRVTADSGDTRRLSFDYAAAHLEHAYALTAHGTQGATVTWAGVIGRPHEFTREWAYTALSRARQQTLLHVIRQPNDHDPTAPSYPGERSRGDTLPVLRRAMTRSETEPLALQHAAGVQRRRAEALQTRQAELDALADADLRHALLQNQEAAAAAPRWSAARASPRISR
jgi:conjugative relaxase-like TrwC/TraI family protein